VEVYGIGEGKCFQLSMAFTREKRPLHLSDFLFLNLDVISFCLSFVHKEQYFTVDGKGDGRAVSLDVFHEPLRNVPREKDEENAWT
jgi:hypothetical protein